jgi:nicotinamide riboside transporter PnuC
MKELFFQYYGIDWIAMLMSLLVIFFIGDKKRYGFIFGMIGACAWIFTNYFAHVWPGVILNIVLIGLYTRGYIKWSKDKK